MRAPLRPLITTTSNETVPSLEINAHGVHNRQDSNLDDEERRFRRASLLSSPSLIVEEVHRINIGFDQDFTIPTGVVGRRLLNRRLSNAK